MSVSNKVSVMIIGATGTLGSKLAAGFQLPQYAPKVNLSLLVRKATAETAGPKKDALAKFVAQGAKLVIGDVSSSTEAELTTAFKGQNVIISALNREQLGDQARLLPAAKAAGVKTFIPSEFGLDYPAFGAIGSIVPVFAVKAAALAAVKASGLDYTVIQNGLFSEYALSPIFGVDLAAGTITAPDSFETIFGITTPTSEIGLLTADVVVSGRGRNQVVRFGDGPFTYEQLAKEIEAASGKQLKRIIKPVKESEAAVAANANDYPARFAILLAQAKGKGTAWSKAETYEVKNNVARQSFQQFLKKTLGGK